MVCRASVRTKDVSKLYAESFRDRAHLERSRRRHRRSSRDRSRKPPKQNYDQLIRPATMLQTIHNTLRDAGVEPDIWKIEGLDRREDCERIVETLDVTVVRTSAALCWAAVPGRRKS